MAVSRPRAVGRRVGVTDDLSGTLGDEIGIVAADVIESRRRISFWLGGSISNDPSP
jgi:hypothetical protein